MASRTLKYISIPLVAVAIFLLQGCLHNDYPYPRIPQLILAIAADGQSKDAYIDSIAYEVTLYLEETTDIENVKFDEYKISAGGTSDPDLLEGTYNLSNSLYVTLTRWYEYVWEIKAVQNIERYFVVSGQIGESTVDPVGLRVIVYMPDGTDLSKLTLEEYKLGPAGITTYDPDLKPGTIDLLHPMSLKVTCHGRTETWTIYAQTSETVVSTTQVDAWSEVIWAYGEGLSDADNGFEYRKASDSEWTVVPSKYVTSSSGKFSCYIPHLQPLTEYVVRTYSDDNYGNEVRVTTDATADIPDGDFEQWYENSSGMWCPWDENGQRYWDTGNAGSITLKQNLTTPSDHTPTGSGLAARCETRFVSLFGIGKLGTGSIFTGEYVRTDGTNGVLAFGRPWTLRPTYLKGYYQYSAAEIDYANTEWADLKGRPDSCHIYVALTDWTAPYEIRTNPNNRQLFNKDASYVIAYGELVYSGQMDGYKEFSIKLDYNDTSKVPTYLQITAASSKYGDYFTGGTGSLLYFDEIWFDWDLE